MTANPDFELFRLDEEHEALREAIRSLAENQIAPHAADVDEQERFPREALDALVESGFNAVHIPDEFDGQDADSVATCIVIEEVVRVCGSSSLLQAVNKLSTMRMILAGSAVRNARMMPEITECQM